VQRKYLKLQPSALASPPPAADRFETGAKRRRGDTLEGGGKRSRKSSGRAAEARRSAEACDGEAPPAKAPRVQRRPAPLAPLVHENLLGAFS